MQAILTVDLEDWYQTNDFNFPSTTWNQYESRIAQSTERVLGLLDEYNAKATFFILGCIAKDYPEVVREIHQRGHEIASHGGWHRLLTSMSMEEIRADLEFAKATLEDCVGTEVTAFRAPSWSVAWSNIQVLEVLQELGFRVDSSMQPFRTPLSGMKGIPKHPFHPIVNGLELDLLEVPPTLEKWLGLPIPFSGGLYLRTLPGWLGRSLMRRVVKKSDLPGESLGPSNLKGAVSGSVPNGDMKTANGTGTELGTGMLYIHPWELDVEQPRLAVSPLLRFTHYYNLHTTEPKVRAYLSEFRWTTLSEGLKGRTFPHIELG